MAAEQILDIIEQRSDELMVADEKAGICDADLKAWEATTAIAYKDAGQSMAEADKRVRSAQDWFERYMELQKAHAYAAKCKRDYQRAVIAQDLWRTERASMRHV
jgi:hypothetical protein